MFVADVRSQCVVDEIIKLKASFRKYLVGHENKYTFNFMGQVCKIQRKSIIHMVGVGSKWQNVLNCMLLSGLVMVGCTQNTLTVIINSITNYLYLFKKDTCLGNIYI